MAITEAGAKALHEITIPAFHDALAWVAKCGAEIVPGEEPNGADPDNRSGLRGDGEGVPC